MAGCEWKAEGGKGVLWVTIKEGLYNRKAFGAKKAGF